MRLPRHPGLRRIIYIVLMLAGLLAVAGCAPKDPGNIEMAAGHVAEMEKNLFNLIFALGAAVFVFVEGLLIFAIARFRHRSGQNAVPEQVHGNTRLEVIWTVIPCIILAVIAVPTITTIAAATTVPTGPNGQKALNVTVIGHQWWWEFDYPDLNIKTADEMIIPTNQPVALLVESADVIHEFWVPRLAGKISAIPNHPNTMWLDATQLGTFRGQCTQLCGESHANMRFDVTSKSPADFAAWVKAQQATPPVPTTGDSAKGEQFFATGPCIACHTVEGTPAKGTIGPNLTHFGSRALIAGGVMENDPANLATWLTDPPAVKPGSLMPNYHLTKAQITDLVAYLESLK